MLNYYTSVCFISWANYFADISSYISLCSYQFDISIQMAILFELSIWMFFVSVVQFVKEAHFMKARFLFILSVCWSHFVCPCPIIVTAPFTKMWKLCICPLLSYWYCSLYNNIYTNIIPTRGGSRTTVTVSAVLDPPLTTT